MYWIFVETDFEASHQLTFADGTQEPLHTHVWHVTAAVCAPTLNSEGLVMDFCRLEKVLKEATAKLSQKKVENLPYFAKCNASAERVARYFFDSLAPQVEPPARLGYIEVTEAPGCRARYQPPEFQ